MKNKSLSLNAFLSCLKTLTTIIFPLITYPYITRVLSVENIGRINFGQSIVSYFMLLAALGISTFAVRNGAQVRDSSIQLSVFSNQVFSINVFSTIASCALLVILVFLPTKIADYRSIIMIQGVAVALSPLAVDWLYIIEEDFGYITLRSFCVHLLSLILMFCFVKSEGDVYLYVILMTMSTSLGNIFNFVHSKKYVKLKLTTKTNWKEYKNTILLFFINSIATIIYMNSDTTLLGIMKDNRAVGLYSVAVKIYTIVKQVFNAVIATTIPRLSYLNKNDPEEFKKLIKNMLSIAVFFTVPSTVGIYLLRNEIITLISGKNYIEASTTLAVLGFAIFFAVMANILANGLLICLGRERYVVKATLISAIANVLLNFIFIPLFSQNGAAITTLIAEIIVFSIAMYHGRDYLLDMINWAVLRNAMIATVLMGIGAHLIYPFILERALIIRIVVIVFGCSCVYFGIMAILRDSVYQMCIAVIDTKIRKKLSGKDNS